MNYEYLSILYIILNYHSKVIKNKKNKGKESWKSLPPANDHCFTDNWNFKWNMQLQDARTAVSCGIWLILFMIFQGKIIYRCTIFIFF